MEIEEILNISVDFAGAVVDEDGARAETSCGRAGKDIAEDKVQEIKPARDSRGRWRTIAGFECTIVRLIAGLHDWQIAGDVIFVGNLLLEPDMTGDFFIESETVFGGEDGDFVARDLSKVDVEKGSNGGRTYYAE